MYVVAACQLQTIKEMLKLSSYKSTYCHQNKRNLAGIKFKADLSLKNGSRPRALCLGLLFCYFVLHSGWPGARPDII